MSYIEAVILGFVQGLTEFIPVSSSGHLILVHEWFGSHGTDLAVDAILQLATILAVLIYFKDDIKALALSAVRFLRRQEVEGKDRTLLFALVVGTLPAIFAGLLLEDAMETVFRNPSLVAAALIAGSILMAAAERFRPKERALTPKAGFSIGWFQALALVPGMSRSGATISGGMLAGLSREASTRFAFLLALPIIGGSGVKKLFELGSIEGTLSLPFAVAFITAFLSGLFCIHYLLKYLRTHTLFVFVWYRLMLAALILIFL